jgi:hypothetical protein
VRYVETQCIKPATPSSACSLPCGPKLGHELFHDQGHWQPPGRGHAPRWRPDEWQCRHVCLWKDPMPRRSPELRCRPIASQEEWRRKSHCIGRHDYCAGNWQLDSDVEGGDANEFPARLLFVGRAAGRQGGCDWGRSLPCSVQGQRRNLAPWYGPLHCSLCCARGVHCTVCAALFVHKSAGLRSRSTCIGPALFRAVFLLLCRWSVLFRWFLFCGQNATPSLARMLLCGMRHHCCPARCGATAAVQCVQRALTVFFTVTLFAPWFSSPYHT